MWKGFTCAVWLDQTYFVRIVIKLLKSSHERNISVGTRHSCDKQRQAMTSSPPIAMSAIVVVLNERCQSLARWTPRTRRGRPWRQSASMPQGGLANEHDKSVVRASWVSRQNSSRDDDYCRRGINRRNDCTSKQTGGHSLTGSLEQIGQNQAPDLLRRERRDQQKPSTKLSSKNSAATMTRGTRVTRVTLAVPTTQASRLAASGTPSPDNKTSASSNDNNSKIPCYCGGFPKKRGCLLFVLWPWPKQEKLSLFFQMVFVITKMPIRWTAS